MFGRCRACRFLRWFIARPGVHSQYFDPTEAQISALRSIKTGDCPEDCSHCPQNAQYHAGAKEEKVT